MLLSAIFSHVKLKNVMYGFILKAVAIDGSNSLMDDCRSHWSTWKGPSIKLVSIVASPDIICLTGHLDADLRSESF